MKLGETGSQSITEISKDKKISKPALYAWRAQLKASGSPIVDSKKEEKVLVSGSTAEDKIGLMKKEINVLNEENERLNERLLELSKRRTFFSEKLEVVEKKNNQLKEELKAELL